MHVEGSHKMHRIIQEAFAEIARRIRANEPTTEWDIAQFMLRRYNEEGMQQEPMIVAVNANTANPHYMTTKEKNSPIRRGDFVLIDAATKLNKPDAVATDQTWTGYVGESVPDDDFETRDSRRIIPGVCFSIEPGIYLEGKFGVRSEINVYVSDKDIEVTGQPIYTEIIAILKTP